MALAQGAQHSGTLLGPPAMAMAPDLGETIPVGRERATMHASTIVMGLRDGCSHGAPRLSRNVRWTST